MTRSDSSTMSIARSILLFAFVVSCSAQQQRSDSQEKTIQRTTVFVSRLSGRVTFSGKTPKHVQPDNSGMRRDLINVDAQTGGLSNAIIFLEPVKHWSEASTSGFSDITMTQEDFTFRPGVIGVRAGQRVVFGNEDPENHNVRADAENRANEFNAMVTRDYDYDKRFQSEGRTSPIRLSCDIHPWMDGWIYVFEHPLFAVTDANGEFTIPDIPAGEYRLVVMQPDAGLTARLPIEIESGQKPRLSCDFEIGHLYDRDVAIPTLLPAE